MPKWPAYLMGGFAAACAYPAITMPPPAETARALDPQPRWNLTVSDRRIDPVGAGAEVLLGITLVDLNGGTADRR